MGTHPIFESDFDCLTVSSKSMYTFELELPFATERHAEIVLNSVVQDEEPRSGSMVERKLSVEKNTLKVNWTAQEARILRTSVNSLLQLISLTAATIEQFDGLE